MASYNTVRTAEAQPIGSVVPWVGSLSKIPKGWLLCNGAELNAVEYPLLARILKDTYGGVGFTGTFPNYSGTFKLPSINQKALADISASYFTSTTLSQPTLNVDTTTAGSIISPYIGTEGDLGPPQSVYAETDMNFSYTPDPDGVISTFTFTGTAPTSATSVLYTNVAATGGSGSGATFNVVKNTNQTYTVILKQKGSSYIVGNTLTISYTLIGGTSTANNITITITGVGNGFFGGTISGTTTGTGLKFIPGTGVKTVYVVPRKLGRNHFPQHLHSGTYLTVNKGDALDTPGNGVGVYDNPTVTLVEAWFSLYPVVNQLTGAREVQPVSKLHTANVWGNSDTSGNISVTLPFETGVGRFALGSVRGTPPPKTHQAITTSSGAHGIGKNWFTDAKNLRDALGNNTVSGNTGLSNLKSSGKIVAGSYIPFSDDTGLNYNINYDDGPAAGLGSDLVQTYTKVLFNNAATSFTNLTRVNTRVNDVISGHDHEGSFNITYDNGSLSLPTSFAAVAAPNVTPDNVPSAFQIIFTIPTASLAITNLIRAY
jgi:microcystin-dependent protein